MDHMNSSTENPSLPINNKNARHTTLKFPVVGIGASAGGLGAVKIFLENMPSNSGMAYVVVFHLSPTHESTADSILQRATKMPVFQINGGERIQPDHVYLIPPNKHLSMSDGSLYVENLVRPIGRHIAVDHFFRTLADVHKDRAIGIVLSGTGSDGAIGLSRVKEQGGVAIAQHPTDAEYDGMPQAAIGMGNVDFVLPVAEMPQKLIDLWTNAKNIQLPPFDDSDAPVMANLLPSSNVQNENALNEIITLLRTRTSHDFRHYKRATVMRRLERRLQVRELSTLASYADLLKSDQNEAGLLLKDMLIGVTNFFRDRESFEALERDILPQLLAEKSAGEPVRAWTAACSTGEEAYSLAMLLSEQVENENKKRTFQVFATDIDTDSLAIARRGSYPQTIVGDVPPARVRDFFVKEEALFRVKKTLRDTILFAEHNLLRDPPFSRLDIISCRNLLIYLNREIQEHVLEIFHFAMMPGGYLFLGSSESADIASHLFVPVDKKNRIYRAKVLARPMRSAPFVPFTGMHRNAITATDTGANVAASKRKFSFAEVHQRVLAQHAPPSVIVNFDSDIVHMSDRAGRFLRHAGGEPSRNLVLLVQPELRLELRTALFQAIQSGKSVEARRVQLKREGRSFYINMTARPFHDDEAAADFVLVLFDEVEVTMSEDVPVASADRKDAVLHQLEEELQRTKEQLQETIEHSETSTEELKASNEELQAINEELRSATEELETSREELQSVNEELITVNYELKLKVEETGKVNDDLNNLIGSTNIAAVFVDKGLRIKRFTPRATDIFSIIPSDCGRSLLDITHRLEYKRLAEDAEETIDKLTPIEREIRSADGSYYIARILPYRTLGDRIEGAVLTFFDISARRQAEERLLISEKHMRLVAESTKDYAIITMDESGAVTSWNKGAERIFGYGESEILGQSSDILFTPEDRASNAPEEERIGARENGRAEDERWHLRKDGSRLYCSGVVTPLEGTDGKGFAKIARDLTDRIQMEGRMTKESILAAQAASDLKNEFFAVLSHELKHPLNLIHINAELLGRLPEVRNSSVSARAAQTIRNAAMSQVRIINDLLDFSRMKSGKLALDLSEVNLSMVAGTIVQAVQQDPAAAGLSISLNDQHPPVLILADLVRIEQVLWNLLSNAVKFTKKGAIEVTVAKEDGFACLTVRDTGQGIAPEYLPYVFDMFSQSSANRNTAGMGIGLTIVKQIVELHDGKIRATSAGPGRGSCFSVMLPACDSRGAKHDRQAPSQGQSVEGLHVLLVDDQEDVITGFKLLLESAGIDVTATTSAKEALSMLRLKKFDVILSDISMPEMSGYEFIKEVRSQPDYARVPAIAVTGLGRPYDEEQAYRAGFSLHVSKPVSLDTLVETISKLCPRK